MRSMLLLIALVAFPVTAMAGTVNCPAPSQLSGTFITAAENGYEPNRLLLTPSKKKTYQASLRSYWSPVPNDDGSRGAIGEFEGELILLKPWSCVAIFSRPENDCHLILRFVGNRTVYVDTVGQCQMYHGVNAYPQGQYEKQ